MCGIRFFRIDDDFRFSDQFYVSTAGVAGPDGSIVYDRSVDDLLSGFQWGGDMNYCVGCRWNFFCDSAFGIYDNHMSVFQQFSDAVPAAPSITRPTTRPRMTCPSSANCGSAVRTISTAIGARCWPIVPWHHWPRLGDRSAHRFHRCRGRESHQLRQLGRDPRPPDWFRVPLLRDIADGKSADNSSLFAISCE